MLPVALPQLVMITNAESPNTTWDRPKAGAAFGGGVVVVVVLVVVGAALVVVGDVVVGRAASVSVVNVGAGGGGSVVWLSPPHAASIRARITAMRRIAAAYTAAVVVPVGIEHTPGRKEIPCLLTHRYLRTIRRTG